MEPETHPGESPATISIVPLADASVLADSTLATNPRLPVLSVSVGAESELTTTLPHGESVPATHSRTSPAYLLRSVIGRGGMGEIWAAEQVSLGRMVAVKRLLRAEGEASHIEFRHEAHVAASLEHPNIVPVHELGLDDEGKPLLVMKLVEGRPWNSLLAADWDALPPDEYLSRHLPILMSMTQAVAFAHSRGIIHRDLKPAQVMVGAFGEVLLTDWGLAIRVGEDGAGLEGTPHRAPDSTRWRIPSPSTASNPAGTPAMMAPEQTTRDASRIGIWTDVYLLGGTLYRLLTGTYPHDARTAAMAMDRAANAEVEPPSLRAPNRNIPRDLEELCLRAVRRDPKDRLESAHAFWQALDEHFRGSARRTKSRETTVTAKATLDVSPSSYTAFTEVLSLIDEARRLWSDNPDCDPLQDSALASSAKLALAQGDLALALIQATAIKNHATASPLLDAVATAEAAKRRRDAQFRLAIGSTITLLVLVALGSALFVVNIREKNLELERSTQEAVDARNRAVAAESETESQRAEAVVQRDLADSARGESEDLVSFMLEDLTLRLQAVGRLDVLDTVLEKVGAQLDKQAGRTLTASERVALRALLERVADVRLAQGKLPEAEAVLARSIALIEGDLAAHPDDPSLLSPLGFAWARMSNLQSAKGDKEAALESTLKYQTFAQRALELSPESTDYKYNLAVANGFVGNLMNEVERQGEALAAYESMRARLEELLAIDAKNENWRRDLAVCLVLLGSLHKDAGDFAAAGDAYRQATDTFTSMLADDPGNTLLMRDLLVTWQYRGRVANAAGKLAEAEADFRECRRIALEVFVVDPTNVQSENDLLDIGQHLGKLLQDQNRADEAREIYRDNGRLFAGALATDPESDQLALFLSDTLRRTGASFFREGRFAEALVELEAECVVLRTLIAKKPELRTPKVYLASSLRYFTDCYLGTDRPEKARESAAEAVAILEGVTDPGVRLPQAQIELAEVLLKLNDPAGARAHLDAAIATLEAMPEPPEDTLTEARELRATAEANPGG